MPYYVKCQSCIGDLYWKDDSWTETFADRQQFTNISDANTVLDKADQTEVVTE